MVNSRVSDSQILAQIPKGEARAARSRKTKPHAASAEYVRKNRSLNVKLANGGAFSIPVSLVPELARISDSALSEVSVDPAGLGIHWEKIDTDLSIVGLIRIIFGTTTLLRALGAAGGVSRSTAKVRAARLNGRKGGRPRKRSLAAA